MRACLRFLCTLACNPNPNPNPKPNPNPNQVACNLSSRLEREAHWRMLLAGGAAARLGMHFHVDALPLASWQLQLEGVFCLVSCAPVVETYRTLRLG